MMPSGEFLNTYLVLGRFDAMPAGQYFTMAPSSEPTKWTKDQADDIVAQNTPTQPGAPELKAVSFEEWCAMANDGSLVSARGLLLTTQPRQAEK